MKINFNNCYSLVFIKRARHFLHFNSPFQAPQRCEYHLHLKFNSHRLIHLHCRSHLALHKRNPGRKSLQAEWCIMLSSSLAWVMYSAYPLMRKRTMCVCFILSEYWYMRETLLFIMTAFSECQHLWWAIIRHGRGIDLSAICYTGLHPFSA